MKNVQISFKPINDKENIKMKNQNIMYMYVSKTEAEHKDGQTYPLGHLY